MWYFRMSTLGIKKKREEKIMKKRVLAMVMTAVMSVMTLGGCGADSTT